MRPGLVHRLDRDTTGLLMIAKRADALGSLREQLRERTMDKRYLAVTVGAPDPPAGLIDAPIGRDPSDPRRMAILDRARPSQTGYETVERFSDAALLECRLSHRADPPNPGSPGGGWSSDCGGHDVRSADAADRAASSARRAVDYPSSGDGRRSDA